MCAMLNLWSFSMNDYAKLDYYSGIMSSIHRYNVRYHDSDLKSEIGNLQKKTDVGAGMSRAEFHFTSLGGNWPNKRLHEYQLMISCVEWLWKLGAGCKCLQIFRARCWRLDFEWLSFMQISGLILFICYKVELNYSHSDHNLTIVNRFGVKSLVNDKDDAFLLHLPNWVN